MVVFDSSRRLAIARLRTGDTVAAVYPDDLGRSHFQALLERKGIAFSASAPGGGGGHSGLWLGLGILALAGGLGFLFLRRHPVRSTAAFGSHGGPAPSRIRGRRATSVATRFSDVAGADEAVEELREVVEFLAHPDRFERLGARIPKGVLLVGPPGTGKTLLARAVAGEAGVPFLYAAGSEFVEMYVGVGARRVRELFSDARNVAPAIVFVDEIDAVARRRGGGDGGSAEHEHTLNQLLVELDGFDPASGVILMAATNRVDVLDPALIRPGRFDRQIPVDVPDRAGRRQILAVHAAGKPLHPSVVLDRVAASTPGFTGADLANLMNEAALLAARRRRDRIGTAEIDDAVLRVLAGPERRSHILAQAERSVSAYHEVGHALVAHLLDGCDAVDRISIVSRGRALGMTVTLPEEERCLLGRAGMLDQMAMILAGRAAEQLVLGEVTSGAADDLQRATGIAEEVVKRFGMSERVGLRVLVDRAGRTPPHSEQLAAAVDDEIHSLLDAAYATAGDLLCTHRSALEKVTAELLAKETLTGLPLTQLLDRCTRREGGAMRRTG
jgi:cell division protease FtsH